MILVRIEQAASNRFSACTSVRAVRRAVRSTAHNQDTKHKASTSLSKPPVQAIHSDDGFDQGASGTHAAAAAKRRVKELEQVIKTEMDRRHEEELRALLEGAPFIMHRGSDKLTRHVWVADVPAEKKAVMRWQSYKGKQWRKLTPGGDHVKFAKEQYHEAAVSLITSVTYGACAACTLHSFSV